MSRTALTALAATLLAATGCASTNRIVGHQLRQVGHWYGELGITGHLNTITVQSQSRLTKLSIIGDANKIVVEDGATLGKIEIWGENNTISVPAHLVIRVSQVGEGNQINRQPRTTAAPSEQPVAEPTGGTFPPPEAIEDQPASEPESPPTEEEPAEPTEPGEAPE